MNEGLARVIEDLQAAADALAEAKRLLLPDERTSDPDVLLTESSPHERLTGAQK